MSETPITHVFFDLHGVLVDRAAWRREYRSLLGLIMEQRYGRTEADWAGAYDRILADWDSYYADLNLSGDDGIADMWEGLFRTTRALFRLTKTPEPSKGELTALSHELPGLVSLGCDALYADVADVVSQLDKAGLVLGVISYSLNSVIEALLTSVLKHFKGALLGADGSERFEKDAQRYLTAAGQAQAAPEACLVVDEQRTPLLHAQEAGMQTIRVARQAATADTLPDLRGLVERLLVQEPDRSKR